MEFGDVWVISSAGSVISDWLQESTWSCSVIGWGFEAGGLISSEIGGICFSEEDFITGTVEGGEGMTFDEDVDIGGGMTFNCVAVDVVVIGGDTTDVVTGVDTANVEDGTWFNCITVT